MNQVTSFKKNQNLVLITMDQKRKISKIQQKILNWYLKNGRDLPWRHTRNPYHILVSEMMLHQTQVDRVIPKYHEFLAKYPSFEALASASPTEVKRLWRPLGYNFRPGRLQEIAKVVVSQYDGRLPDTFSDLIALPGIGRYTAGAILSFAFHKDAPIVDTNVRRVLQRIFGIKGNPLRQPVNRQIWTLASAAIPQGKAYIFNQALLDFGAMVCTARNPKCLTCHIRRDCNYFSSTASI